MARSRLNPLRMIVAALMPVFGVAILVITMNGKEADNRDFIAYWATGQQLTHHANPYDGAGIHRWQHQVGYPWDRPFFMRNAPTALFLAYPLGFVSARVGAVLWVFVLLSALMVSIKLLWVMVGRPPDRLHLVGHMFPPVYVWTATAWAACTYAVSLNANDSALMQEMDRALPPPPAAVMQ